MSDTPSPTTPDPAERRVHRWSRLGAVALLALGACYVLGLWPFRPTPRDLLPALRDATRSDLVDWQFERPPSQLQLHAIHDLRFASHARTEWSVQLDVTYSARGDGPPPWSTPDQTRTLDCVVVRGRTGYRVVEARAAD